MLIVGDKLGPYEISARLGAGGMGEVWKARDTRLGRDVAIKTSQQRFSERFELEAKALSKLNHPHICQIYDVGPDYIVMELIDGKPLRGPLPIDTALDYAAQICDALDAAHSCGIVHRDLKPDNILLMRHGVKLVDFGLAKVPHPATLGTADGTVTAQLTGVGQIVGTLNYMSPEQLQAKAVDTRSDIFSLGLVLYEIITGQRAFDGDNPASIVAAILKGEPRPLVELQPAVPARLSNVLKVCLAKDPEARWQSARDLQRELNWLRTEPAPITARRSGRFAWKEALVGGAIIASLAAGVWIWGRAGIPDLPTWSVRPLTAYAGIEEMPAISPDGSQVAFGWNGERQDNYDIYVKQIGNDGPPLRITQDGAVDYAPCWSPDGSRIAFLRERSQGSALMVASSLGGGERAVATLQYKPGKVSTSTISWSPDGRFIAAPDGSRIVRLDLESREVHPLTAQLPAGFTDRMPSYAPDGSALAFTRGPDIVARQVWIQKLDRHGNSSASPTRITDESNSFQGIAWLAERGSVLTSRGFPGSLLEMLRVPLDGGAPQVVPVESIAVSYPSYNAKSRRLVYQRQWLDLDILRASLDKPNDAPTPVIASTHLDFALDLSPDGKRLIFVSTRNGRSGIWRAERDGTNQILLASSEHGPVGSPRWSPDGKWGVFDGGREGASHIYAVSADGGNPKQLTSTALAESRPSVSPDGKWIYFASQASGQSDIWRQPWDGGTQSQVTRGGGNNALPSADGKWVYYTRAGGLWRVPPAGGMEAKILDDVRSNWFTLAGDRVYYFRTEGTGLSVAEYEPSSGQSRIAYRFPFNLDPYYAVSAIAVSLATREVFVQHRVRLESDLVLVENFR